MSTEIKEFKGLTESVMSLDRCETTLSLTRFWGGAAKGISLQLTIHSGNGFIQFTKEEAFELAYTILESFNNDKYPSE